uniref:Secreted protein n=1 Tax=Mus musculus TaxID=10090 RepID=Q9D9D2_MOUSE|nr:unnamed protein product [Mus musculus]
MNSPLLMWLCQSSLLAQTIAMWRTSKNYSMFRINMVSSHWDGSIHTPRKRHSCPVWISTLTAPTSLCCQRPLPLCVPQSIKTPAFSGSPTLACLRFLLVKRRASILTPRTPSCSVYAAMC